MKRLTGRLMMLGIFKIVHVKRLNIFENIPNLIKRLD